MTKEAKLQAAMRILPEWTGYDEEIKALQQKLENEARQLDRDEKEEKDSGAFPFCAKSFCNYFPIRFLQFSIVFQLFFD